MFTSLSLLSSLGISVLISSLLVLCLHFRTVFKHRNTTEKIKERFFRSLLATLLVTFILYSLLVFSHKPITEDQSKDRINNEDAERGPTWLQFSKLVGLAPSGSFLAFFYTFVALIALFWGNFLTGSSDILDAAECFYFLYIGRLKFVDYENELLQHARNFLIAPAVEEYIYRACLVPILLPHFGWLTVLMAPMLFGIAHLHHAYELYQLGRDKFDIITVSSFQMLYTTIFGCYTSYIFLIYQNFYLVWAVHSFCNIAGLPDFQTLFQSCPPKLSNFIYLFVYVTGILCFVYVNFNFIHKPDALEQFYL